jgi:hypothetical protein
MIEGEGLIFDKYEGVNDPSVTIFKNLLYHLPPLSSGQSLEELILNELRIED